MKRSSQRNQRDSPLLRLPAELRNHIWQYVFNGPTITISNVFQNGRTPYAGLRYERCHNRLHLGLLRVSRQVHAEMRLHQFRCSLFFVQNLDALAEFLSCLTNDQQNAIERISMSIEVFASMFVRMSSFWGSVSRGGFYADTSYDQGTPLEKLGGLRKVNVSVSPSKRPQMKAIPNLVNHVRSGLKQLGAPEGVGLEVIVGTGYNKHRSFS